MARIVVHTPSLRGGGAERVSVLVANEFARRGHAVRLFVWNGEGPNAGLVAPGVDRVDLGLPIHGEGFGKGASLKALARSAAFYRKARPDAVFSAMEFANVLTALALTLAGSRARFFPSFHAATALKARSLGTFLAPALSRFVAARATCAIAVSRGIADELAARGFPPEKRAVIHNPLPPRQAQAGDAPVWTTQLAAMGEGPVIVTLGRLTEVKDHETLLQAFALLDGARRCRLVIFGDGPLREALEKRAAGLGIGARVLFAGYSSDPYACYESADLFVLSSRTEGFGNVLIEAMSVGVPVVSTDAPHGPREILADGAFGALVPVGDAAALARAIESTLDAPPPDALLRARAEDFSPQAIGDRYEALLA